MTEDRGRLAGVGRTLIGTSAGVLASALVGFGRNLSLAAAIGTGLVADAYNVANQVPAQIFLLFGGGTLAVLFVPEIMRHARTSAQRSDEYGSFLLFASVAFGLLMTLLLVVFSPLIIKIMGGSSWSDAQSSLGLRFSLWCMPQITFAAMFSVAGQLMIARGRIVAIGWMPTVNSLVIIAACIPVIAVGTAQASSPGALAPWEVTLLGGSTLLGSALQSMLLIYFLHRGGFRLHVRFIVRGLGLRRAARAGLLTITAGALFQISNLTITALSTQAGSAAKSLGHDGRGFTALFYALALMSIAQAMAVMGLANVLLQRLSQHYAERGDFASSKDLDETITAVGSILIPVTALFICLGPLGTELIFTRGETSLASAQFIGIVLAVLSLGLIASAMHEVLIRTFYAANDARTPLRSAFVIVTLYISGSFAASFQLPPDRVLLGIAGAFSLAYLIDLPLKLHTLHKKLKFKLSRTVIRCYGIGITAGIVAALIIRIAVTSMSEQIGHSSLARGIALLGGFIGFLTIYYPLTARSPASLGRLFGWLTNSRSFR